MYLAECISLLLPMGSLALLPKGDNNMLESVIAVIAVIAVIIACRFVIIVTFIVKHPLRACSSVNEPSRIKLTNSGVNFIVFKDGVLTLPLLLTVIRGCSTSFVSVWLDVAFELDPSTGILLGFGERNVSMTDSKTEPIRDTTLLLDKDVLPTAVIKLLEPGD